MFTELTLTYILTYILNNIRLFFFVAVCVIFHPPQDISLSTYIILL